METEEMSEQYISPCFVSCFHAYDGEINLEYENNMISNKFAIKLFIDYEEKDGENFVKKELLVALKGELYFVKFIINPEEDDVEPGVVLGRSFLRLAKGIVDFGNGIITIYPDLVSFNDDSDDDWEAILASVDDSDLPQLDVTDVPTPSLTVKKPFTQEEVSQEDMENDIYERIMILQEPRPIIETLKFSDQHKKLLDSVLLDKLKLDEEVELEEEAATEEVIRSNTGSNINVIPYRIYAKLRRDQVKPMSQKITMLDHSKSEPMGILRDVLSQVGVTTIIAKFLILDIPVDRDVPIVVGRSFLYTRGSILNPITGTTSTFDGVCHQKFYVAKVRNNHEESDSDDEENTI
ncbi:reverse transcriptase domain-containing protein [Tanacetum coccineum]